MAFNLKQKLSTGFQKLKDSTTLDEKASSLLKPITNRRFVSPIPQKPSFISQGLSRVKSSFSDPSRYFVLSPSAMSKGIDIANQFSRSSNKYVKSYGDFGSNIINTFNRGGADIGTGIQKFTKPGILPKVSGGAQIARGIGRTLAVGTAPFQIANIAATSPGKNDAFLKRAGKGFVEGMTGINAATNAKGKYINTPLGTFDPTQTISSMVGFTQNPINKQIFNATEKILPSNLFKTPTKKWLTTTAARGGIEGLALGLADIDLSATPQEKLGYLIRIMGQDAVSEIVGRGVLDSVGKGIELGKNNQAIDDAINQLQEGAKRLSRTVRLSDIDPKTGKRIEMPMWQYMIQKQGFGLSTQDINKLTPNDRAKLKPSRRLNQLIEGYAFDEKRIEKLQDIPIDWQENPRHAQKIQGEIDKIERGNKSAIQQIAKEVGVDEYDAIGAVGAYIDIGKRRGNPTLKDFYDYFDYEDIRIGDQRVSNKNPIQNQSLKLDQTNQTPILDQVSLLNATSTQQIKSKTNLLNQAQKLRQEAQPLLDEAQASASIAKEARGMFKPDMIAKFNKIKRSISRGNFTGDIETLRSSKIGKDVNEAVEAVMIARPDIVDESEALDFVFNFPTKADTRTKTPPEIFKARELEKRAKEVVDTVYNASATPETKAKVIQKNQDAIKATAENNYREWQRSVWQKAEATPTSKRIESIAKLMKDNTQSASVNIDTMRDISNTAKGFTDVYRNFKKAFGKNYDIVKKQVLDPFDKSKSVLVDALANHANKLEKDVVNGLGIEKGSRESALVQLLGEGKMSIQQVASEVGIERAKDIAKADMWFRREYDRLLGEVNNVMRDIYPNNPEKIIPKRKNYYRHFRDISSTFGGLKNLFETPANINAGLAGVSADTKPLQKWLSFAQRRLGDQTDIDAVGGFIDYVKSAEYAKNIDPHIRTFRELRDEIVAQSEDTGAMANFSEFLHDFANDLAGKTNEFDRSIQKVAGRKAFRVLNWINSRVKANVIVGNLSSTIAQFFNIPQGVAEAGVQNSTRGMGRTISDLLGKPSAISKSDFVKERYADTVFDRFDKGIINNTKKFASWITGVGDEMGTRYIWNSVYEKAISEGIQNPIKYADDITRNMVAGRGIGEVPLAQKSKTFQLIAPFQLEVANIWHVMRQWGSEKQAGKFITFFVASHIMNKGAEAIRGSGVTLDPIEAMQDAYNLYQQEENKRTGAIKAGGRLAGEVLSNIPGGQTIAGAYDEYGGGALGAITKGATGETITREELFGDADPTRFGSGLLASQAISDPLFKLVPAYGGGQLKKTLQGLKAYGQGYSETASGRVRYPIAQNATNAIKSAAFGQYSTKEAREYFDEDRTALGEKDSEMFKQSLNKQAFYDKVLTRRSNDKAIDEARERVRGANSSEVVGSKIVYYDQSSDKTDSIDIGKITSMPENTNLARELKQKEVWSTTNKLMKADIDPSQRQQALKALGVKEEEAAYYTIAKYDTELKMAYLKDVLPKFGNNRDAMLQTLAMMRGEINGERILNNTMIDELYKSGVIGVNEKSMLKSLGYKDGKVVNTKKSGGKKIKAPSLVTTSELLKAFNDYLKARANIGTTPSKRSRSLSDLYGQRRQRVKNMIS